jgi:hypothetical protein
MTKMEAVERFLILLFLPRLLVEVVEGVVSLSDLIPVQTETFPQAIMMANVMQLLLQKLPLNLLNQKTRKQTTEVQAPFPTTKPSPLSTQIIPLPELKWRKCW